MLMRPAAGAGATAAAVRFSGRRGLGAAGVGRGEHGEFLLQPIGAALRAFGAFPIAGTNKNFVILSAFFAVKFVDRHGKRITRLAESSSQKQSPKLSSEPAFTPVSALPTCRLIICVGSNVTLKRPEGRAPGQCQDVRRAFPIPAVAKLPIGCRLRR
jgi:hypothetical protein